MPNINTTIRMIDQSSSVLDAISKRVENLANKLGALNRASAHAMSPTAITPAAGAYSRVGASVNTVNNTLNQTLNLQQNFITQINQAASAEENLSIKMQTGTAKSKLGLGGIAASFVSIRAAMQPVIDGMAKIANSADTLSRATSGLKMINDGSQSDAALQAKVRASAIKGRAGFTDTAEAVGKMGLLAGDKFKSNDELINFTELVNKSFAKSAPTEKAAGMLQLTQAMSSGALQGDELRSIRENAPVLFDSIAKYLDVSKGKLKEMGAEGKITGDVIKNSILANAEGIEKIFESTPKQIGQTWQQLKDSALLAFQPVLEKITEATNSERFQSFAAQAGNAFQRMAEIASWAFNVIVAGIKWVMDNWLTLKTIALAIAYTFGVYGLVIGISAIANSAFAKTLGEMTLATMGQSVAQWNLNAALAACPLVWIAAIIVGVTLAFYGVVAAINHFKGTSISATGVIFGAFNWLGQAIYNIFIAVGNFIRNIFITMINRVKTFANFFRNVFKDPIGAVQMLFLDLADTALGALRGLAKVIDNIFGTKLADSVDKWRGGIDKIKDDVQKNHSKIKKTEMIDYSDYELERKNLSKAYSNGYNLGNGLQDKFTNFGSGIKGLGAPPAFDSGFALPENGGTASKLGEIADNTKKTAESLSDKNFDLIAAMATRAAVNRGSTSITVNMTNHNSIGSKMDIDGVVSALTSKIYEEMDVMAEGGSL